MSNRHHYGWRRTPAHLRPPTADHTGLTILDEVDPRNDLPAVYNQLQLGSCTGHATEGAFEYDMILDGLLQPGLGRTLSALDIYWHERQLEDEIGKGDTGAIGSDAFRAASTVGICKESDWPYDPNEYNVESYFDPSTPPAAAAADSKFYVLTKPYQSVTLTVEACKAILSNRQTIAFGFDVYESFESAETLKTGIVPMPDTKTEQLLGGHEVLAVGYLKDEPDYALVRNSWGPDVGIAGYFLFPWKLILSSQLAGDQTTIVRPAGQ